MHPMKWSEGSSKPIFSAGWHVALLVRYVLLWEEATAYLDARLVCKVKSLARSSPLSRCWFRCFVDLARFPRRETVSLR